MAIDNNKVYALSWKEIPTVLGQDTDLTEWVQFKDKLADLKQVGIARFNIDDLAQHYGLSKTVVTKAKEYVANKQLELNAKAKATATANKRKRDRMEKKQTATKAQTLTMISVLFADIKAKQAELERLIKTL